MANKYHSDVNPGHGEKNGNKQASQPSGKTKPGEPSFKKHPRHTGPKVAGPGEYPGC